MLLNLIKHSRTDIDKIYTSKIHSKLNYQLLMNGREKVGTENLKNII